MRYSFCKQTSKVHPPSSPYITLKIRQMWFSCKGRKPRNKKTKVVAENQRNAWLCIAESQVFLIKTHLCIHPQDWGPAAGGGSWGFWGQGSVRHLGVRAHHQGVGGWSGVWGASQEGPPRGAQLFSRYRWVSIMKIFLVFPCGGIKECYLADIGESA